MSLFIPKLNIKHYEFLASKNLITLAWNALVPSTWCLNIWFFSFKARTISFLKYLSWSISCSNSLIFLFSIAIILRHFFFFFLPFLLAVDSVGESRPICSAISQVKNEMALISSSSEVPELVRDSGGWGSATNVLEWEFDIRGSHVLTSTCCKERNYWKNKTTSTTISWGNSEVICHDQC